MNFKLKIWRQRDAKSRGKLVNYEVRDISPETSFLEMLDILNENLIRSGGEPVAFDSDCREGICGTCSLTVNGEAHGPDHPGAVCELYMRKFRDGDTITSNHFGSALFRSSKIWWSIAIHSIGSCKPADSFRRARAQRRKRIRYWFLNTTQTWRWRQRRASAAARARRRARTDRRCFLRLRKFRTFHFCRRARRNVRNVC